MTSYRGYRDARKALSRRDGGPGRADIIRAVPGGSRRIRGCQIDRTYVGAVSRALAREGRREDFRESVTLIAGRLARTASYETGCSRPTRTDLCAHSDRSVSTFKAARRWLEARGFLGTVTPGCKRWRPGPDGEPAETRCDAAVYVLCIPRRGAPRPPGPDVGGGPPAAPLGVTRPPTGPPGGDSSGPRAGTALWKGPRPAGPGQRKASTLSAFAAPATR